MVPVFITTISTYLGEQLMAILIRTSAEKKRAETHWNPDLYAALPPIMTVPEAAAYLRIGRTRAYELVRTGILPSVKLGRLVRIPRDLLLAWLATDTYISAKETQS